MSFVRVPSRSGRKNGGGFSTEGGTGFSIDRENCRIERGGGEGSVHGKRRDLRIKRKGKNGGRRRKKRPTSRESWPPVLTPLLERGGRPVSGFQGGGGGGQPPLKGKKKQPNAYD